LPSSLAEAAEELRVTEVCTPGMYLASPALAVDLGLTLGESVEMRVEAVRK
jgi:hypothetical protein